MEITNLSHYGDFASYVPDNGPPVISRGTLLSSKVLTKLPRDTSRPKPFSLMSSLTSRGVQSTKIRYPLIRRTRPTGWWVSGTSRDLIFGALSPVSLSPDWVSPHRTRIADRKAQLSSFVAELHEATTGFTGLAHGLKSIAVAVGKRSPSKLACGIASTRLAINFGLRPLVNDMYLIAETVSRSPSLDWQKVTTTVSDSQIHESSSNNIYTVGKTTASVRATSYVKLNTRADSFDVGSPDQWIWENIPFSFVVDYAIDIGGYLTALHALRGLSVSTTCVNTRSRSKGTVTLVNLPSSQSVESNGSYDDLYTWRSVYPVLPLPPLPSFSMKGSLQRLGNTLALLTALRC